MRPSPRAVDINTLRARPALLPSLRAAPEARWRLAKIRPLETDRVLQQGTPVATVIPAEINLVKPPFRAPTIAPTHDDRDNRNQPRPPPTGDIRSILDAGDLHRLLVESVQDYAIFALYPQGYILSWNAGAQRFKGYTADEVLGKHFSIFYPRELVAEGFPAFELRTAANTGRFEDEGWRIRKDGSRFWANVVITALRDREGRLTGFAKVTRDLTERREAEEAIRESEERFRLILEGVRDYAIFMLDPRGRVATWNTGAERLNGYRAKEITGVHFSKFYPPDDVAAKKPEHELEVAVETGKYDEEGWRVP